MQRRRFFFGLTLFIEFVGYALIPSGVPRFSGRATGGRVSNLAALGSLRDAFVRRFEAISGHWFKLWGLLLVSGFKAFLGLLAHSRLSFWLISGDFSRLFQVVRVWIRFPGSLGIGAYLGLW